MRASQNQHRIVKEKLSEPPRSGAKFPHVVSIYGLTCGQTQKTGLFHPQFGKEQAHLIYRENASFHELLQENKRKEEILANLLLVWVTRLELAASTTPTPAGTFFRCFLVFPVLSCPEKSYFRALVCSCVRIVRVCLWSEYVVRIFVVVNMWSLCGQRRLPIFAVTASREAFVL